MVGSDAAQVALWLETLALFTRREDRAKTAVNVSPATGANNSSPVTRRYVPDLLLQGIISNDPVRHILSLFGNTDLNLGSNHRRARDPVDDTCHADRSDTSASQADASLS